MEHLDVLVLADLVRGEGVVVEAEERGNGDEPQVPVTERPEHFFPVAVPRVETVRVRREFPHDFELSPVLRDLADVLLQEVPGEEQKAHAEDCINDDNSVIDECCSRVELDHELEKRAKRAIHEHRNVRHAPEVEQHEQLVILAADERRDPRTQVVRANDDPPRRPEIAAPWRQPLMLRVLRLLVRRREPA